MTSRHSLRLTVLIPVVTTLLVVAAGPVAAKTGQGSAGRSTATVTVPTDCHAGAHFKAAEFPNRPRVDNKWFPLVAGTTFVMKGTVVENHAAHQHQIVTTVTDLTKMINGVRTVVVLDVDFDDGELQESELAFMAQDNSGSVWNLGEYPEEYVDGKLDGAPSTWIAGIAGARAGIGMLASPRVGRAAYLQGVAPKVDFRDCAEVVQTGRRVCVPVRCYNNVLVTEEWAPQDPEGGHQLKYYAPGVGNVKIGAIDGVDPEVLQLARHATLSAKKLAAVRQQVLAQDRRGYKVSPKVYGRTAPARRASCG